LESVDFIVVYFVFGVTVINLLNHLFPQIFKAIEALFGFILVNFEIEIDDFKEFTNYLVMNGSIGKLRLAYDVQLLVKMTSDIKHVAKLKMLYLSNNNLHFQITSR